MSGIKRGDIFFVKRGESIGSEQRGGCPGIIVSNNLANRYSPVVQVVFLTTKRKAAIPTHIPVQIRGRIATALCEQITPVDISRLGEYGGHVTAEELQELDRGLCISIGILQ